MKRGHSISLHFLLLLMTSPNHLSNLLQSWQPETTDPCDFNCGVWSRIEAAESQKGVGIAAWIQLFARPRIAVTATMIALFGGLFLGSLHARSAEEGQYLRSLNPYTASSLIGYNR